ncbi:hypothetical protein Z043_104168 [Scleropages formosus]|uniref:HMG box domain-containing protein n=1 Tax=Scleropages formosus TaxID=113540 RepID=A0A0P7XMJ0_SCLFO|nr:hypothetical protein Z043_104168 [Scleropages formosus]
MDVFHELEPQVECAGPGAGTAAWKSQPALALSFLGLVLDSDETRGLISPICHMSNKVSVVQQPHGMHSLTSLLPYSSEPFSTGSAPLPADLSTKPGIHRPSSQDIPGFYSLPPSGAGQIPPSMGWQSQSVYPLSSCGFRQPYSPSLPCGSSFSRFPHSFILGASSMHPTGIPHPAIVPPTGKHEEEQYDKNTYMKPDSEGRREKEPKKPVIKKPLNAFMLYMKEMRAKVIAECTLKESAAINQILGRKWHALSREEQAKYYEQARKERQLHMQLYPSWSARDNYGKKKKRKREKQQDSNSEPNSAMRCRARFGLSQQTEWCAPCRRKKKCIRYLQGIGRCSSPRSSDGSATDEMALSPFPARQAASSPASMEMNGPIHRSGYRAHGHPAQHLQSFQWHFIIKIIFVVITFHIQTKLTGTTMVVLLIVDCRDDKSGNQQP